MSPRSKTPNKRFGSQQRSVEDLYDERLMHSLPGPLQWYLEDEIALAKNIARKQKQKAHNKQMERNIRIGKRKLTLFMKKEVNTYPRWYQDFSIDQVKNLMILQSVIDKDYEEMVTGRTQRILITIGIISTFFTLTSGVLKKLQESSNCSAVEFLREIYKTLTGNYFEEEGYKQFYNYNERIILSAIAFLTLPEAVVELHKRLPPIIRPKLPSKPELPIPPVRKKMSSPYEERLFIRPDWASYYNDLQYWQKQCELIAIPKIILPPKDCIFTNYKNATLNSETGESKSSKLHSFYQNNQLHDIANSPSIQTKQKHTSTKEEQKQNISSDPKQKYHVPINTKAKISTSNLITEKQKGVISKEKKHSIDSRNEEFKQTSTTGSIGNKEEEAVNNSHELALNIPQLPERSKIFDFTINGISDKPGPVEYKICGILQPPQPNKKSWLDEKHAHYIISGTGDEPPSCPVTYEMTGIANVTPINSDEKFFAILKLGDGPGKIYPSGRENLSPKWQEWLQNADEEFLEVEREANKMIKSIEAITKLVFPGPTCDSCCSCRQTRKSYLKAKETKAPYLVIDTLTEDNNKNKYIVGSMAMHSPAPTPPESTVNLLEYIASEDVLTTNVLINGVTNEKGETQYFISGVKEDIVRRPGRIVERPPPRPPRNVPPCVCAIQQVFTKGLSQKISHDHIPWTKEDGLCFGKKFRPNEFPAYSCKMYPGDKSCRRNPFMHEINKLKRKAEREKQKEQNNASSSKKKRMYSIADFQPCGDEHGMNICGGPWGALHTLTPEELAEQERLRKKILRGPPCGTRPGRAVCEGPFGERIPIKRPQIEIQETELGEEEEEDLEDEEEEEDEEKKAEPTPVTEVKQKEKKRQKECYMSPESIASRKKTVEKKIEKFIPDPTYPGYDDPWNVFRTAPSQPESTTNFVKLLKLSSPEFSIPSEAKMLVDENEKIQQSSSQKDVLKISPKQDSTMVSIKDSKKTSPISKKSTSERISKKHIFKKPKSNEKIKDNVEKRTKSVHRKNTREIFSKSSEIPGKSEKTTDKVVNDTKGVDDAENKAILKLKESKHGHQKLDKKITHFEYSKTDNELHQAIRTTKPINKNIKLKPKKETTDLPQQKLSKRFHSKTKQDEMAMLKKSGNNKVKMNKKTIMHDNQFNKKFKKKLENSLNVEINKETRISKDIKKSYQKQNSSTNTKRKKISKMSNLKKKNMKRDKKKDIPIIQDGSTDLSLKNEMQRLKSMTLSELYPYDVKPVDLPEEPPAKCKVEYEDEEDVKDSVQVDEEVDEQLPNKGPCGWRTKSEQKLPTKKTLVYLTEPDYPAEIIPVRPGGKPCICRENRAKKKVLLYNIGGLIGGKKEDTETALHKKLLRKKKDEDDKQMQVIDGIIYYTPPPSPRRSDEYVPEYDLYESPYDMCLTQRRDENIKLLEKYSSPKDLALKALKNTEPCGCNEYIDVYGIHTANQDNEKEQIIDEFNKTRKDLIEAKAQKERWKLAFKDIGLIDYYTRCRDSVPCWLKCGKFNKVGCGLPYKKLKIKRPVCECKYERKILEHNEEKKKWKERRERLKSLKKQPFMNVANISKPIVTDTKLMISGVKRIPRENEYIDDVKYCITGVAENYSELPSKQIVGGVEMATPIQTPEQSVQELPCVCLHRHWSLTNIPPGPLPKPKEIMLAEKKRRQKAAEEAYQQMFAPQEVYDTHNHSCKTICDPNHDEESNESTAQSGDKDNNNNNNLILSKQINVVGNQTKNKTINPSKQMKQQIKLRTANYEQKLQNKTENIKSEINMQKSPHSPRKQEYKNIKSNSLLPNLLPNEIIKLDVENVETFNNGKDEMFLNTETDLMIIAKNELKKMAKEGFLFAKLPKCFLMPQLQYWLMYRKGIAISEKDNKKSMIKSIMMWNVLDVRSSKIQPLPLQMTKLQLRQLTFDHAEELKEKIANKKEIFYSHVRKDRVLYSRSMWNTMDYGKFPSTSFKEAYFTYMANKESSGCVFKPWFPFEVRDVM